MKPEEAIELLKGFYLNDCESDIFLPCYLCENPCEDGQKILLAIEALEAQKNIVHCRDCKWFKCDEMICAMRGAYGYEPDDFCSWGDLKKESEKE